MFSFFWGESRRARACPLSSFRRGTCNSALKTRTLEQSRVQVFRKRLFGELISCFILFCSDPPVIPARLCAFAYINCWSGTKPKLSLGSNLTEMGRKLSESHSFEIFSVHLSGDRFINSYYDTPSCAPSQISSAQWC